MFHQLPPDRRQHFNSLLGDLRERRNRAVTDKEKLKIQKQIDAVKRLRASERAALAKERAADRAADLEAAETAVRAGFNRDAYVAFRNAELADAEAALLGVLAAGGSAEAIESFVVGRTKSIVETLGAQWDVFIDGNKVGAALSDAVGGGVWGLVARLLGAGYESVDHLIGQWVAKQAAEEVEQALRAAAARLRDRHERRDV